MLTNLFILILSLFGLSSKPSQDTKPSSKDTSAIEVPKPTSYEKGGQQPGGGWDLN